MNNDLRTSFLPKLTFLENILNQNIIKNYKITYLVALTLSLTPLNKYESTYEHFNF